ncbi:MAG: glycosyltransferase family 4 protein [Spirochaetes bacterium]|nr:MAG: glycosyltransferase family 4 protein [Spirochaetota bacterium]
MVITGQFNDSLPPIMDGVATTARNYAYWLNRNYAPSFAVGPRVPDFRDEDDFTLRYRSLPSLIAAPYRLGVPRVDRNFNKAIESIPFDLVHAHCPFVSGNYAYTLARKRNIPMVATFHSKYRDDFASWMRLDITIEQAVAHVVKFYNHADSLWVPNEAIIETLREYGYRGPVEYIPNGSDMAPEEDENLKSLELKGCEILRVKNSLPVLIYVGQHRWIKNLRLLIKALAVSIKAGAEFNMRFVGDGPDIKEMKQLVMSLGLNTHVDFIGPVYNREELKAVYAASNLLTFPSLYDNASLVTREAAGFCVPTLFSREATTAAGIVDGKDGFLSGDSVEEYGQRIAEILSRPDHIRDVGAGARETLYKSWEDIVGIVYEKYQSIVDEYKWRQIRIHGFHKSP